MRSRNAGLQRKLPHKRFMDTTSETMDIAVHTSGMAEQ
jgi:hypothetical protein